MTIPLDLHFTSAFRFASSDPSASRLSSTVRLQLYANYKVATAGYPSTSRPSVFDFTGRAKWDAWKSLQDKQMDATSAKNEYIRLLGEHTNWTPPGEEQVVPVPPPEYDSSICWSSDEDEAEEKERAYERRKVAPKSAHAGSTFTAPFSTLASHCGSLEDRSGDSETGSLFSLIKQGKTEAVLRVLSDPRDATLNCIDVNFQDQQGITALHWATDHGNQELVKSLVETMGAKLDIQDHQGQTCLHYAAISGHVEIGRYLLQKGADARILDEEKCMAFELADDEEFAEELKRNSPLL